MENSDPFAFTRGQSNALVDGNFFGIYPNGTPCNNITSINLNTGAADATISNNINSATTYGIGLWGSAAGAIIRGNQIGVQYTPAISGNHEGADNEGVLLDTGATWIIDSLIGRTIENISDGSSGIITDNDVTTITVRLSGGTDNDWDSNDNYSIRDSWIDHPGPSNGIYMGHTNTGLHFIGGSQTATSDSDLHHTNVIGATDNGIYIFRTSGHSNDIHGNFIGTNPEQDEIFAGTTGILIDYVWGVRIGGGYPGEAGNVIANQSAYGFSVVNENTKYVRLSRNSFYDNGDDTGDDAIYLPPAAKGGITRPVIDSVSTSTITVSGVQAGDIVEVFLADFDGTEYGEGKIYITSGVVAIGQTTIDIDISGAGLSTGDWLSVTRSIHYPAVNPIFETSAFSSNMMVP